MATQGTSNAAIGEGLIAGLKTRDLESVLALMHPEVEIFEPESLPYGGKWSGRDGFAELLQEIMGLADISIGEDAKIHETSDGLIMEMQVTFTSHKDGEAFTTSAVEIDRLKDGLVREIDVFYKDVAAANEFFARQ